MSAALFLLLPVFAPAQTPIVPDFAISAAPRAAAPGATITVYVPKLGKRFDCTAFFPFSLTPSETQSFPCGPKASSVQIRVPDAPHDTKLQVQVTACKPGTKFCGGNIAVVTISNPKGLKIEGDTPTMLR